MSPRCLSVSELFQSCLKVASGGVKNCPSSAQVVPSCVHLGYHVATRSVAFDLANMVALTPMPLYIFRLNVVIEDG